MIYPYVCAKCEHDFEIIKPMSESQRPEHCEKCGEVASRRYFAPLVGGLKDLTSGYNPAFGCVVRNKHHQNEILSKMKDQGREMIEIGTEPVEKIHKKYDSEREAKSQARWNEPTEKIIQEVLR